MYGYPCPGTLSVELVRVGVSSRNDKSVELFLGVILKKVSDYHSYHISTRHASTLLIAQ